MTAPTTILRKWSGRKCLAQELDYAEYFARTGLEDDAKTPSSLGSRCCCARFGDLAPIRRDLIATFGIENCVRNRPKC